MAKLFEQPRFIAVEGPIRVGKSSLAQRLAKTLHAQPYRRAGKQSLSRPLLQRRAGHGLRRADVVPRRTL